MLRNTSIMDNRFFLFTLIVGLLILARDPVLAGEDIVGKWKWVENQTLVVSPGGTLEVFDGNNRINTGKWECLDPGIGRYVFRHQVGGWVDTVTLSPDGNALDGTNNRGARVSGTRIGQRPQIWPCGDISGTWSWVSGQKIVLKSDSTFDVFDGDRKINDGKWECTDPGSCTFVFRHREGGWVDTVKLSSDGNTLSGTNNAGQAVRGTRSSSPPPPPAAADVFIGDWLGAYQCADPANLMDTVNIVIWRENGQILWTDWNLSSISPGQLTDEGSRYKLVATGHAPDGKRKNYIWYIDKGKNLPPLMYGEAVHEAYPTCRQFRYVGLTHWTRDSTGGRPHL